MPTAPAGGGRSYRVDPAVVRGVISAVDGTPIDRFALTNGYAEALGAFGNTDDLDTDDVIHALGGIAGDLSGAAARIDARVSRAAAAAGQALAAVEDGDDQMSREIGSSSSTFFSSSRFGGAR